MNIKKCIFFNMLAGISFICNAAADQSCDKEFLVQLQNNEKLTHLQRLSKAKENCVGKSIEVQGIVDDVGSETSLEMVGKDGLEYDIYLSPDHTCGDMLAIEKGKSISISGKIHGAYPHWPKYSVDNAKCVK